MTDMDEVCQHLLQYFPSRHRHGNLLDMYDSKAVSSVFNKQCLQLQRWQDFIARKRSTEEKAQFKLELVTELKVHILEVSRWAQWPDQCACMNHGVFAEKYCNLVPPRSDGSLWLDMTSPSCVPWSAQGRQLGWLQHENLPTLFWGMSLAVYTPDLVALECTPRFDTQFVEVLSGRKVIFNKVVLCPPVFGIPVTGSRVWAVAASEKMQFVGDPFARENIKAYLLRSLVGSPDMFLGSSVGEQLLYKQSVNASQAKIPPHPRGKQYSWDHVISTGNHTRLEFHRVSAEQHRKQYPALDGHSFVFDIGQNVGHHRRPSLPCLCPRPLTGSFIWCERLNRPMLPKELLRAQGNNN